MIRWGFLLRVTRLTKFVLLSIHVIKLPSYPWGIYLRIKKKSITKIQLKLMVEWVKWYSWKRITIRASTNVFTTRDVTVMSFTEFSRKVTILVPLKISLKRSTLEGGKYGEKVFTWTVRVVRDTMYKYWSVITKRLRATETRWTYCQKCSVQERYNLKQPRNRYLHKTSPIK